GAGGQELLHSEALAGPLLGDLHHGGVLALQQGPHVLVVADPIFAEDVDVRGHGATSRPRGAWHTTVGGGPRPGRRPLPLLQLYPSPSNRAISKPAPDLPG